MDISGPITYGRPPVERLSLIISSVTAEDRNNHLVIPDLMIRQYQKELTFITLVGEERSPMNNPSFLLMIWVWRWWGINEFRALLAFPIVWDTSFGNLLNDFINKYLAFISNVITL